MGTSNSLFLKSSSLVIISCKSWISTEPQLVLPTSLGSTEEILKRINKVDQMTNSHQSKPNQYKKNKRNKAKTAPEDMEIIDLPEKTTPVTSKTSPPNLTGTKPKTKKLLSSDEEDDNRTLIKKQKANLSPKHEGDVAMVDCNSAVSFRTEFSFSSDEGRSEDDITEKMYTPTNTTIPLNP